MANDNLLEELGQIKKNAKKYVVRGDQNTRDVDTKKTSNLVHTPITMFDGVPERALQSNWNGGIKLLTAGTELSPTATQLGPTTPGDDITVTKGNGKILVVVVAGADVAGTITVTGSTVNRNTGVVTGGQTNTITVDAVTTNDSTAAGKGSAIAVHDFTGAYITDDWFTGSVVLSSTTLNCTVYVYHVSFEQFNDQPDIVLTTFDGNIYTTNAAAEFDAYLYTLHKGTGNNCRIDTESELHVGTDGETAIANKYWRLRKGNINESLNGQTDGFWVDVHYLNSPVYVQDVTLKVWYTQLIKNKLSDIIVTLINDLKKQKIMK